MSELNQKMSDLITAFKNAGEEYEHYHNNLVKSYRELAAFRDQFTHEKLDEAVAQGVITEEERDGLISNSYSIHIGIEKALQLEKMQIPLRHSYDNFNIKNRPQAQIIGNFDHEEQVTLCHKVHLWMSVGKFTLPDRHSLEVEVSNIILKKNNER